LSIVNFPGKSFCVHAKTIVNTERNLIYSRVVCNSMNANMDDDI
jgi:hypothetical protein